LEFVKDNSGFFFCWKKGLLNWKIWWKLRVTHGLPPVSLFLNVLKIRTVIVDSARRWRKSCQRSFSLFWHHPTFQFLNSQCTIFFLSSNLVRLACRSRQRRICIIAYASWTTVLVFVMATGTRNKCWRMRG